MTGQPLGKSAPRILNTDILGRDVLSRRVLKKIQAGRTPFGLFWDNASPTGLSVNRLTTLPGQTPPAERPDLAPDKVIAKIGDLRAKALGRVFYGWGVLSAENAAQAGRTVRLSPQPGNDYHADIILPDEAEQDERARERHARNLAALTRWRPRPTE